MSEQEIKENKAFRKFVKQLTEPSLESLIGKLAKDYQNQQKLYAEAQTSYPMSLYHALMSESEVE